MARPDVEISECESTPREDRLPASEVSISRVGTLRSAGIEPYDQPT
jgi:hypothetical protein